MTFPELFLLNQRRVNKHLAFFIAKQNIVNYSGRSCLRLFFFFLAGADVNVVAVTAFDSSVFSKNLSVKHKQECFSCLVYLRTKKSSRRNVLNSTVRTITIEISLTKKHNVPWRSTSQYFTAPSHFFFPEVILGRSHTVGKCRT